MSSSRNTTKTSRITDTNKPLCTLFIRLFQSEEFQSFFRAADINIAQFIHWLHADPTNSAIRSLEYVARRPGSVLRVLTLALLLEQLRTGPSGSWGRSSLGC